MSSESLPFEYDLSLTKTTIHHFLNSYSGGVVFVDKHQSVQYLNQAAEKVFGVSAREALGRPFSDLTARGEEIFDRPPEETATFSGEVQRLEIVRPDGSWLPVEIAYNVIQEQSRMLHFYLVNDISAQVELQQKLYNQSITDALTGLFNRRFFDQRISQEFVRASRYRRQFSVMILDIDGFKMANDQYGHSYGDQMLVRATEVFRQTFRDGDCIFRYGGDEFAMLLPETTKEGAVDVAERMRDGFASQLNEPGRRVKLSLSIGIASHPEDGKDEKTLLTVADKRMYHAKEQGGNRITAYDKLDGLGGDAENVLRSLVGLVRVMEKRRGHQSSQGISHSQEMRALAVEVGRAMALPEDRLFLVEQGAVLHDIGTIHLPISILNKAGPLSPREWEEMKRHTLVGEEIIGMVTAEDENLRDLKNIIAQHHECIDGSGYPYGLTEREILLEAKVLAVADAYSAMVSDRPYRKALGCDKALEKMQQLAGSKFDPEVVQLLVMLESESCRMVSAEAF